MAFRLRSSAYYTTEFRKSKKLPQDFRKKRPRKIRRGVLPNLPGAQIFFLRDDSPVHIDAASHLIPLREVAVCVVTEHSCGVLPDEEIILAVTVVVARTDDEPVVRVELSEAGVALDA